MKLLKHYGANCAHRKFLPIVGFMCWLRRQPNTCAIASGPFWVLFRLISRLLKTQSLYLTFKMLIHFSRLGLRLSKCFYETGIKTQKQKGIAMGLRLSTKNPNVKWGYKIKNNLKVYRAVISFSRLESNQVFKTGIKTFKILIPLSRLVSTLLKCQSLSRDWDIFGDQKCMDIGRQFHKV